MLVMHIFSSCIYEPGINQATPLHASYAGGNLIMIIVILVIVNVHSCIEHKYELVDIAIFTY